MEVRKTLLPHDVLHSLDCASENCGITAAADIALRLYGETDALDAIWNRDDQLDGVRERLRAFNETGYVPKTVLTLQRREIATEQYAAEIIRKLPPGRRAALVERGVLSLTRSVRWKAEWLAECNFEDRTKGGCLRPYQPRVRLDRDMRPTRRTGRRLHSPKAIRRYVAEEGEIIHDRELFRILASIPIDGPATEEDRNALFRDLNGQLDSHQKARRRAVEYMRFAELIDGESIGQVDLVDVRLKPGVRTKMIRQKRESRRVTKRAAVLAAAILGASTVSAFARGEPVLIYGSDLALSARLRGGIASSGHGAVDVGVHTAYGVRLASLCVYQEAPALDQLVSIAMHVKAGAIEQVLEVGNLYAIQPAGDSHPVIAARRPTIIGANINSAVVINQAASGRQLRSRVARDETAMFQAEKAAYAAKMRPVYEVAIATFIFGRAVKIWRQNRDVLVGDDHA